MNNNIKYPLIEAMYKSKHYVSASEAYNDSPGAFSRIRPFDSKTDIEELKQLDDYYLPEYDGFIENHCLSSEPSSLFYSVFFDELYRMGCIDENTYKSTDVYSKC